MSYLKYKMLNSPILTIAIPTRNRSNFLFQNLLQLKKELRDIDFNLVELIVSDNFSTDNTQAIVNEIIADGLPVCYIRNKVDIGWGQNFIQCFNMASGVYVLILGDDDFFVDGALSKLIFYLNNNLEYGVVSVKTYGFDIDYKAEYPGKGDSEIVYRNSASFIRDAGALLTLISACVINKRLIKNLLFKHDNSPNLPILHYVLRAAISGKENLLLREYMIGCKRNNSANYNYSEIFVREMWDIIYLECSRKFSKKWLSSFENKVLLEYYPLYILQLRLSNEKSVISNQQIFEQKFGEYYLYKYWLRPIFIMPRYIAIIYGIIVTTIGRIVGGDLRRGFYFIKNKIFLK